LFDRRKLFIYKKVKVAVLTTETPHHIFFVKELAKEITDINVICEKPKIIKYNYKVEHDYEILREKYENKLWFKGKNKKLEDYVSVKRIDSINSNESFNYLREINESIFIVFGTRILKKNIYNLNKEYFFNLHGGDPSKYRGLDSHLWAIYNKDFSSLVTTLHRLDQGIDTGEIFNKKILNFNKNSSLINLRSINTIACVELVKNLIFNIKNKTLKTTKQKKIGKYYSAMPHDLKDKTHQIFKNYILKNFKND